MGKKIKYYFENEGDEYCCTLDWLVSKAKCDGVKQINVKEAIECKSDDGYINCECGEYGCTITLKSLCNKADCSFYFSKSGRGVCKHRGKMYKRGKDVTFNISKL